MLQASLLLMKNLNKTDPHFLSVTCSSRGNLVDFYYVFIIFAGENLSFSDPLVSCESCVFR